MSLQKFEELSEADWVLVYTSGDELEIGMLKGLLESAGLKVNVSISERSYFTCAGRSVGCKIACPEERCKICTHLYSGR